MCQNGVLMGGMALIMKLLPGVLGCARMGRCAHGPRSLGQAMQVHAGSGVLRSNLEPASQRRRPSLFCRLLAPSSAAGMNKITEKQIAAVEKQYKVGGQVFWAGGRWWVVVGGGRDCGRAGVRWAGSGGRVRRRLELLQHI